MNTNDFIQNLADARDAARVGGKAINLGRLLRAGFPAPGGFVITTDAYRYAHAKGGMPAELADAIRTCYQQIGSPTVAVRSSATAEDMADASMAGQYETFLDINGVDDVLNAVQKCWSSLDSPRTRSYLHEHGIDIDVVAMAVVVQILVPADVAGVLFTANARTGALDEMLIEASWGLGESVVSGNVQPDVLRISGIDGRVLEAKISDKATWIAPGSHKECATPANMRNKRSLNAAQVLKLWELGRHAATHFRVPQDIEWAFHNDELFILQTRNITTLGDAAAYEECLHNTRTELKAALENERGPWVTHNIAETLPHPTPLTWSFIRRFMSGEGGYGNMYRQAGFVPAPIACAEGFLTLIAGRPYMDLKVAPEMFFQDFPFAYDPEEIRNNPEAGQAPPTVPIGGMMGGMNVNGKLAAANRMLAEMSEDFDKRLSNEIIPAFAAWCKAEKHRDLTILSDEELLTALQERETQVLDDFGPSSMLPSLIDGMILAELHSFLNEHFWDDDPYELSNEIVVSSKMDSTLRSGAELYEVATGTRTLEKWIKDHGYRGPAEFDLSSPRWRERPEEARKMAQGMAGGRSPQLISEERHARAVKRIDELQSKLSPKDADRLEDILQRAGRYINFREDGKDYLMLGYDLLRDVALEAGRRLGIGDDVFLLTREEFTHAVLTGYPPLPVIDKRKMLRAAEDRIQLPNFIDEAELERIGEPIIHASGDCITVFPISSGTASGPARIILSPEKAGAMENGYILVCPSTDPSWTPLFVNAAGLVLERGGTLSHGAVVAREMGIPAVVLAGATELLQEGETITVDGRHGKLYRGAQEICDVAAVDENDTHVARELVPPVPGDADRRAGMLMNLCIAFWAIYLAGVFLLPPQYLKHPSYAILDSLLWPLVNIFGKPITVAIIACAFAIITMVGQSVLTNNKRIWEAKRRAALLTKEAATFPTGSPRNKILLQLARPVQGQISMAAFVPLALVLGPMVMTFSWLPERLDPAAWSPAPGTSFMVLATVDATWHEPVSLDIPGTVRLDETTPREQSIPQIKETLEKLQARWAAPSEMGNLPWDVQAAAKKARAEMLADLQGYLKAGVTPQTISWRIRPADMDTATAGKFDLTLTTKEKTPIKISAVLGDKYPPALTEITGGASSPVKSVKIVYDKAKTKQMFWTPFARFGKPDYDPGWLWIYLLAYIPPMVLLRMLLRLA